MRPLSGRVTALVLAGALALPEAGLAQGSPAPAVSDLAGSWEGWARLTNDWPGLACRYEGGPEATSVRLELGTEAGLLKGSVALDLAAEPGSGCPPLRQRHAIAETAQGPGTLSFTDAGGNEWTLAVRRSATVLQGLLAWREGGPEQPLAEGFAAPGGERPLARLSGEVRLRRASEEAAPAAEPAGPATPAGGAAAAPTPKAGAGTHARNLGIVIGANVVGLGLLYGVNKLGQGGSESGVVTCSPRVCIVGATINDPCYCEGNVVSGASCGTTDGGAPQNAPCDGVSVPCQSGLSCNSGVCQDRDGRCGW
jgi:hypothetical protein